MKLTKRKALEIARDLWTWLSEDGNREKADWPGWDEYVVMEEECPCCEYVEAKRGFSGQSGCGETCPLTGFAWDTACFVSLSFYMPWRDWNADITVRAQAARAMAMACDFALLELDDEKKEGKNVKG